MRNGFTTSRERVNGWKVEVGEHRQQRGWQIAESDLFLREQMIQLLDVALVLYLGDDTSAASKQGNEYLHDRHVKIDAGKLQHNGL